MKKYFAMQGMEKVVDCTIISNEPIYDFIDDKIEIFLDDLDCIFIDKDEREWIALDHLSKMPIEEIVWLIDFYKANNKPV